MEINFLVMIIHLIAGSALVYIAVKAFKKTKYPPMALLAVGFALIVVGDTILGDALKFIHNVAFEDVIEEAVEIAGFLVLILAIKRS